MSFRSQIYRSYLLFYRRLNLNELERKLRYNCGDGAIFRRQDCASFLHLLFFFSLPYFWFQLLGTNGFLHIVFTMTFSSYSYSPVYPQSPWKDIASCPRRPSRHLHDSLLFLAGKVFSPSTSIPTAGDNTLSRLSTPQPTHSV